MIPGESWRPQGAEKEQKLVSISSQYFTTKESLPSAHIYTRISLTVTLKASEKVS